MTSTALVPLRQFGQEAEVVQPAPARPVVPAWLVIVVIIGFLALSRSRGTRRWE